ncbi:MULTISPECIES: hypothetical protein [Chryseobacterium]|jgi:hypothetical protein|nr:MULTISPECIES: hypothetical protein [Chryseobacterium]AZA74560.1 hypothetical protein EG358_12660 [Chryseobacterium indoltheticum]AZB29096.1 hypothetical protein EB354_07405 [Chryseobacterium balustinum]MDF2832785.1 hypothetical protein [Chryseobacterium indoltheticum]QQQ28646.1 hypothetical protein JJL46_01135 [Chryseobacterium indoltheticum]
MMKKIAIISILNIFLISCVSTKVSSKNDYDYTVLKNNSKYIIETKDGKKIRQFEFLNQTENAIIGKQENSEVQIEKNNIDKILKPSTGKTIPLVVGIVGAAVLIPAYVGNKPVGQ